MDVFASWMTVFLYGAIESKTWHFEWARLFEIVSRTRLWLRPSIVSLYVITALMPSHLPGVPIFLVLTVEVKNYLQYDILSLIFSAAAVILVAYLIHYRALPRKLKEPEALPAGSGHKGGCAPKAKSQTTRLLCASAFLAGAKFREQILRYFEHESRSASPELGVNMRLVAMVCQYANIRAELFDLYLCLALVAGLTAAAANLALGILVFLLTAAATHFKMTHDERVDLTAFCEGTFNETTVENLFAVQLGTKIISALPREYQNLIVYTGFTPFVGAGIPLGSWSFVVDISKADSTAENPRTTESFKVEELYAEIVSGISASRLEGLVIKDYYFVNGREIRADREILPDIYGRPVQYLNHESAQRYLLRSDTRIRHYAWIRIHDWDQELVISYFVRFAIRGRILFGEINKFLLTPLREEFRRVDAMTPLRTLNLIGMLTVSAFIGPGRALCTPLLLFGRLIEIAEEHLGRRERARHKDIERNPLFDYGAGQGYRQAFSSSNFKHFFQRADGDFYAKAIESTILDKTISFLDEHHVDTSSLRERQSMILNSGIIVHGGDVKAESLAVGPEAQAIKTHTFQSKVKGEAK